MTTRLDERRSTHPRAPVREAPQGEPARLQHCDACGAAVLVAREATAVPVGWGEVWFCDDCVHRLPAAEIERRRGEIALRGVPMA
jgi:hypothetical protein